MVKDRTNSILRILSVVFFLYLFLVSIGLMGEAFKGFGRDFAQRLIATTSNPFVGLFIGILTTSLVQSSSTTTCIVVGMVSSGVLTVPNAVPIVLGANVGTTVTNTLVSLGHISRREEFKRAVSGSTVHDFFNLMCVAIILPLELLTGFLSTAAVSMTKIFANFGGFQFTSPLKAVTEPGIDQCVALIKSFPLTAPLTSLLLLAISCVFLFLSLYFIVKNMRGLVVDRVEILLNNVVGRHGLLAIFAGMIFTAVIQSSSITTSLMIPLVASGILTVETIFPITMGANIGTTVTSMLAAFATGNPAAISVAFSHFLFNLIGVTVLYPIRILRTVPVRMALHLGNLAYRRRRYVPIYVLTLFFLIPALLIFISRIF
ncbi:MAG: hypothetical protein GF333_07150 [Candidatus Omnitrophica bacterium]|nr:hypothetical protein [Candidatus Omnitrophota bacterium]